MSEDIKQRIREGCKNCSIYKNRGYNKEDCLKCFNGKLESQLIKALEQNEKLDKALTKAMNIIVNDIDSNLAEIEELLKDK